MTGPVTYEVLSWLIGAISAIVIACFWIWWRFEAKVKEAEDKADKAITGLADHKLHTAETYVTKAGMQEQTSQIMGAIGEIKRAIDGTNSRIDMIFQNPPVGRRSRGSQE